MYLTRLKWWFYKQYVWIGLGFAATITKLLYDSGWDAQGTIAGLVAVGGYFHFVQRQRLEEMGLFKDLFTNFNCRYDRLNEKLSLIQRGEWTPELESKAIDYLNLCAEEYLFYKHGYILPEVWESWRNGMRQYMDVDSIRRLWAIEVKTESYYGLTRSVILD